MNSHVFFSFMTDFSSPPDLVLIDLTGVIMISLSHRGQ